MIKLSGKYSTARVMADTGESSALDQIKLMLNSPAIVNPVAVMPDFHAGAGAVIGFTMQSGDYVIPNIIGVDINCGMLSFKVSDLYDTREEVGRKIREAIPLGTNTHKSPVSPLTSEMIELGKRESSSNCGSLTLEKDIKITRWREVTVEYFDLLLEKHVVIGYLPTHQHEIEHNLGILITDRRLE